MRKLRYLISALLVVIFIFCALSGCGAGEPRVVSLNSQTGIYVKDGSKPITLNGESISVYNTYSDEITLEFEAYHVDGDYENRITINGTYEFALDEKNGGHAGFVKYSLPLLGLNIINGSMKVKFAAGADYTGIGLDTFYVRNVVIRVGNQEIWSDNYDLNNYKNEKIGIGEQDVNSDFRFGIVPEREFCFTVPQKTLNAWGYMFSVPTSNLSLTVGSKSYQLESKMGSYSLSVTDGEVITADREISVTGNNIKAVYAAMDGVSINLPLKLSSDCWVNGKHTLDVVIIDESDYAFRETIEFTLNGSADLNFSTTHNIYNNGAQAALPTGISDLGIKTDASSDIITPFSELPFINFEILENTSKKVAWTGYVNANRTAFLQLYNFKTACFDTVATCVADSSKERITLAFD